MATLLDSLTYPSCSNARMALRLAPAVAPSSLHANSGLNSLPTFTGLKIRTFPKIYSASSSFRTHRVAPRRGSIVCEASEAAIDAVPNVTDGTWESIVLKSDTPVLVEFWAPWCGPCRLLLPTIEALSKDYAGKLKCYKLNTDESPNTASIYGIRSIPTIIIFMNGEKKDTIIGAVPKSTLTASIDKFL